MNQSKNDSGIISDQESDIEINNEDLETLTDEQKRKLIMANHVSKEVIANTTEPMNDRAHKKYQAKTSLIK